MRVTITVLSAQLVVCCLVQVTAGVSQKFVAWTVGSQSNCARKDTDGLQPRSLVAPQVANGCGVKFGAT